ncbi:hypothetical protein KUCAC02_021675, partial [Chaenocephalus aceratus]
YPTTSDPSTATVRPAPVTLRPCAPRPQRSAALLPAQPKPAPKPQWSQECRRVTASVWDLARQKLRVTSTPSHFEMDPWWQLLGDPSDVSISLSKEIARGST